MSTDAQAAESSAASVAVETETVASVPSLPVSRQQRQDFLKAANEPAKQETSQTEEIDTSKSSASKDESASAPEAGKNGTTGKRNTIQDRIKDLSAENQTLHNELTRRKQLKADLEALNAPEPKKDAQQDSSTAAKPEDGRPVKPKSSDFDDFDKYEAARDEYYENLADWKADQKVKGYDERQTRAQQQRTSEEKWKPKIQAAIEKQPDYLTVVGELAEKKLITPIIDRFATKSEHGAEMLYRIGEDLQYAQKLAHMDEFDAMRELIRLESEFTDQTKTAPKQSPKLVSTAPRPERVLSSAGGAPPDDEMAAVASGDFERFKEAKRAKELAERNKRLAR